jgi:hypothetical protein
MTKTLYFAIRPICAPNAPSFLRKLLPTSFLRKLIFHEFSQKIRNRNVFAENVLALCPLVFGPRAVPQRIHFRQIRLIRLVATAVALNPEGAGALLTGRL